MYRVIKVLNNNSVLVLHEARKRNIYSWETALVLESGRGSVSRV